METIIICLLVLAIALLIYVITQGKKEKNNVIHNEDPLAGLPDIIGRPKNASNYSSPSTAQSKREGTLSTTDNFDKRNERRPKVYKIPQEEPEVAEKILPDWMEEEEEMERSAAYGTEEGFAMGVTFDELASLEWLLERDAAVPSDREDAISIISKIDGTELLNLLESKVGEASRKIATLLDSHIASG
ncbi:conjugal transfer protein TraD [Flavobacterium sp. MFBS3-15]|uniref:conjugal transfer protein TraD n=1 Tax=Flavobacterium sp. MFBS3-15 TaxID=2989816 RepID=UPI0022354DCD|nr:conjugal transfer protein TraD [Flavobacterium sp. MFBS3-15]MCW4470212.1 conjugal transfer protein TraD [Flavobacterium sp. MFBS3-15]